MVWAFNEREKEEVAQRLLIDLERLMVEGQQQTLNFESIANILRDFDFIFPAEKDEKRKDNSNDDDGDGDNDDDDKSFYEEKMMKYLLEPSDEITYDVSVRNFSKGMHLEMDTSGHLYFVTTIATEVSIKRSYMKGFVSML